jgi:hypothetical protein
VLSGLGVFLKPGDTVLNDDDVDTILGGTDSDWFIYDPLLDSSDRSSSEPLN